MWNPKGLQKPVPLMDLKESKGNWEYSELYRDIVVAKEWNLDPIEFWNKPRLSRLFMIAYCETSGSIQSFEMDNH